MDLDPVIGGYANKYMENFITNQTFFNEIMFFNLVPENFQKGKVLDQYLRELLAQQDKYTAFLIHVGTRKLPRQLPAYVDKTHYHVSKKVADVGFVWHSDT